MGGCCSFYYYHQGPCGLGQFASFKNDVLPCQVGWGQPFIPNTKYRMNAKIRVVLHQQPIYGYAIRMCVAYICNMFIGLIASSTCRIGLLLYNGGGTASSTEVFHKCLQTSLILIQFLHGIY